MADAQCGADVFVIAIVRRQDFAFPVACVQEVLTLPDVTPVHTGDPALRGVINLRGRILPLVDLRVQFGWRSMPDELAEFCRIMSQREADHKKWLDALEHCVEANGTFTLATDPHNCAFGRWYYSYQADSPWVAALLAKFDAPHRSIHAVAEVALGLLRNGRIAEARRLIAQKRERELVTLERLFHDLKQMVRDSVHELAVVINDPGGAFAITIDQAVAAERIGADHIRGLPPGLSLNDAVLRGVVERNAGKDLALIVEPSRLACRCA